MCVCIYICVYVYTYVHTHTKHTQTHGMLLQLYLEENTLNALTKPLNAYVRKGKSLKVQELITIYLKKSEKDSQKTHPPKRREQVKSIILWNKNQAYTGRGQQCILSETWINICDLNWSITYNFLLLDQSLGRILIFSAKTPESEKYLLIQGWWQRRILSQFG